MKKSFLLLALCLYNLVLAIPLQDRKIDPTALSELTSTLGISPESDLIAETQARWLRKPGQERWEMEELSQDQKNFVLLWSESQGLFSEWKPLEKTYDKALILGASTSTMQKRLGFLKQLWEEGVRFQEIIWLTGDRPLDPRIEELTDRCTNESEAARIIWEETQLPLTMRNIPIFFVATPMKDGGKRPNTEDTLVTWLNTSPQPCKTLFISNQPFCGYQFAIVKKSLPDSFLFDVVGPSSDPTGRPASAAIALDSIARWLYNIRGT